MLIKNSVRLSIESLEERLVFDTSLIQAPQLLPELYSSTTSTVTSNLGAEQVLRWNSLALQAIAINRTAPPLAARNLAMISIAMFDAANGIARSEQSFLVKGRAPRGTNMHAAIGYAAHKMLVGLFPAQKAIFDTELRDIIGQLPRGLGVQLGKVWGAVVANRVWTARKNDGATDVVTYQSSMLPGRWQPTPPAFVQNPLLPQWPGVTPFAITSGDQFRAPVPPALNSQIYADNLNEVKSLGSVNSLTRTADQTQIARFWAAGAGTVTPPGMWNVFAQQQARDANLSTVKTAKLLAVLNVAMADAGIACWDSKYVFDYWRPVTAIRQADLDGNDLTQPDPGWTSLIGTPPFPSYTSGHSTFSAAAAEVFSAFFGAQTAFSGSSDGLPGVVRHWNSFRDAATEAGDSRIFGGIHFRFDSTEGLNCGRQVGIVALQKFGMQPAA
ncbi:MAG: vanadium-dependent haloperoxidase [Planctomycetia bacterium]|nr:vanadium-dependent haloperoxidase [Planctomycetia bacterium]